MSSEGRVLPCAHEAWEEVGGWNTCTDCGHGWAATSGRVQTSASVGIQRNAARCHSCGDEIESTHRHDFRSCSCGNLSVDGGRAYIKRGYRTGSTWDELTVCHHRPNPYMPERCEFCGHPTDENGPSDKTTPARVR